MAGEISHLKKGDISMESKTLDPVLEAAKVRRNSMDEMQIGDRKKRMEESYGNKEVELKKNMMLYPGTGTL